MSCLIGPLFVYWSSNTLLNQRWLFLKAQQAHLDSPWQYLVEILDEDSSEIVPLRLQERTTLYVVDKQDLKSYALILETHHSQPGFIAEPLRVIFAKHINEYNPIPYAEFWKGGSQSYWRMSQQHRSRLIPDLYCDQFRPMTDFDDLELPVIKYPEVQAEEPQEALSIHQVTDGLAVQSWLFCKVLPDALKPGCLYFTLEGTERVKITIEFYPGVKFQRFLTSLEVANETVLDILDQAPQDASGIEVDVFEELQECSERAVRDRFYSEGSISSLSEYDLALLDMGVQTAASFRQIWPTEQDSSYEQLITASSFDSELGLSLADDQPTKLSKLQHLIWGLSSADRHTLISVLAPDWLLDDPHFVSLRPKEQHVALAYLLKRIKPQDELPLFLSEESQKEYCRLKPHVDYLSYDLSKPMEVVYTDMLGRTDVWQLKTPLERSRDLVLLATYTSTGYEYYKIPETFLKNRLLAENTSRPFPRDFHVYIDNFIQQYLMPSGVAALFLRQWSSVENSPCVGVIDTYYQYLLLYSLRYLGYQQPIEINILNTLTSSQKVYQLQQHFGVERLIYPGLSQRGQELYQQIMGAIYNPTGLRDQSLATLASIEATCSMILERQTTTDADLHEAVNDIVASINAVEERDFDDEDNLTQQNSLHNLFEEHLENVLTHITKYRFFHELEALLSAKHTVSDYDDRIKPVVMLFFEMHDAYRNQHRQFKYRTYPIWLSIFESCDELIKARGASASRSLLHGYIIARSELARSYTNQYPSFFYARLGLKNAEWDGPSILTISTIMRRQAGNFLVDDYYNSLSINFKKALHSSELFLPFYRYILWQLEKDPGHFELLLQSFSDESLAHPVFFTREDRAFYHALCHYLKISYDFYKNCAEKVFFPQELEQSFRSYLAEVTSLLPFLKNSGLVDKSDLHFFRGYKEQERKYPIPVNMLRSMKSFLEPLTDEPQEEIDFFKLLFHKNLKEQIQKVEQERAELLISELQKPDRAPLELATIKQYCYDIYQINAIFLQRVLKYTNYNELTEIVNCFLEQGQQDEVAFQLSRIKRFLDLLIGLERCYIQTCSQADYHDLLEIFVQQDPSSLAFSLMLLDKDQETITFISEKFFKEVDLLTSVLMATQGYTDKNLPESVKTWMECFNNILVSRLKSLSSNNVESLSNILLHENKPSESQIGKHLSTIMSWDKYQLLTLLRALSPKYWSLLQSATLNGIDFWRNQIKQDMPDYPEIILILNALPTIEGLIDGTGDLKLQINVLIKKLSSETSELRPANYNWVASLFKIIVSNIDYLDLCEKLLTAADQLEAEYSPPRAGKRFFEARANPTTIGEVGTTIYMDSGLSIPETSEAFMLRTLRELVVCQQLQISQHNCQKLADSFSLGGVNSLKKNIRQRWTQVHDLTEEFLLKWLSVFHQDVRAFEVIVPYLLSLPSINSGKISLWAIFERLEWNKNYCHSMLQDLRYQCKGEDVVRSLNSSLKYLTAKHGGAEIELDEILELLAGKQGFAAFAHLLQKQRLIFLSEWVPGLMSHISKDLSSWLKTKEDLIFGVYFLGLHNIDALCGADKTQEQTYIQRYTAMMVFDERSIVLPLLKLADRAFLKQYDDAGILSALPVRTEGVARFNVSRLSHQWRLEERELYLEQHIEYVAHQLSTGRYSLADVLLLSSKLHESEIKRLEEAFQDFVRNITPEDLNDFFQTIIECTEKAKRFIAQLQFLPHKAQLQLIAKGLSPLSFRDKELGTDQFMAWSDFLFHLLEQPDLDRVELEILSKTFEFLVEKHEAFVQISEDEDEKADSPFIGYHQTLRALWQYFLESHNNVLIQPRLLKEIADFFDEINKNHQLMLKHPEKRELVHRCLKIARRNMLCFWEMATYQIIDSAHIFAAVYNKLEVVQQEQLWSFCEKDFRKWVQNISDLCALLKAGNSEQQKSLLKVFPHAYNWVRNPHDLNVLLTHLIDKNIAIHLLKTWPLHLWMHQVYDYVEILQQARVLGVAPEILSRYRTELYSVDLGPEVINIAQWQRLTPQSCDLIKMMQAFPEQSLGVQLVEVLLYQEALSASSITLATEELLATTTDLIHAFETAHQAELPRVLKQGRSDYWSAYLCSIWPEEFAVLSADLMEQGEQRSPLCFSIARAQSSQALIISPLGI